MAKLAARQSDPALVVRAMMLAMIAPRPVDQTLTVRCIEALLELSWSPALAGSSEGMDVDLFIEELEAMVRNARLDQNSQRDEWLEALTLVVSDRQWQRDGYRHLTAVQLTEIADAERRLGEPTDALETIRQRTGVVISGGIKALGECFMGVRQFQERLDQLPTDGEAINELDRSVLPGYAQLTALEARAHQLDLLPMPHSEFADLQDSLAAFAVQPLAVLDGEAADLARDYREMLKTAVSYLLTSAEVGGAKLLPRYTAVVALTEELRHRGALLAGDAAETARTFDRWLLALEHAGADTFRTSPEAMRSAFVRLLSATVPEGFDERVGVLAARLEASDPVQRPAPLDARARGELRARLRAADTAFRTRTPAEDGGQQITSGVTEAVARLTSRIAQEPVAGSDERALRGVHFRSQRWLTGPLSFDAVLAELESDGPAELLNTPSGLFVPAKGAPGFADDGRAQLQAAFSMPLIGNTLVIHVHTDGNGRFVVGDALLEAEAFFHTVIQPNLESEELQEDSVLVLVGCEVNAPLPGGRSAAQVIRDLAPRLHLVSADSPVFTTPKGEVLAGRYAFDSSGLPIPGSWQPGNFTLLPGKGGKPVDLGPDLLPAMRAQVPAALGIHIAIGANRPGRPPREMVRWMPKRRPGSTGHAEASAAASAATAGTVAEPAGAVREEDLWVSFGDPGRFQEHILAMRRKTRSDPFTGLPVARLVGGHQLDAHGTIKVWDGPSVTTVGLVPGSKLEPLTNGVFSAVVQYRPLVGQPLTKQSGFFPVHLTWTQIRESAAQAYRNAVRTGEANLAGGFASVRAGLDSLLNKFVGTDVYGNWLAGYVVAGQITSVFPLYRDPSVARSTLPNPWVAEPVAAPLAATELVTAPEPVAAPLAATEPVVEAIPAQVNQDLAHLAAAAVRTGKAKADQVKAWVTALWGPGLRAFAAAAISLDELTGQLGTALERVQKLPTVQRGPLTEALRTLEAVLMTQSLVKSVASGAPTAVAAVDEVLTKLRTAASVPLPLDEDFREHADEMLTALAAFQALSADWTGTEPWPARFSQWAAVLHSGLTVARQESSVPRGVYDQHLQVLATSGIALLEAGELTPSGLTADLRRLALRPRHETEQRMWLSDLRYAIGSRAAETAVEAANERIEYLTQEQKRLDEGQGKNPAQRRASGTDDRYTTWAAQVRERADAFHRDMEQLASRFPALQAKQGALLVTSHTVQIRKELWLARELGYMPFENAESFIRRTTSILRLVPDSSEHGPFGQFVAVAAEAIRTVGALVRRSGERDATRRWADIWRELSAIECTMLLVRSGNQYNHASLVIKIRGHSLNLDTAMLALEGPMLDTVLSKAAAERETMIRELEADDPVLPTFLASIDALEQDVKWGLAMERPTGLNRTDLNSRAVQLTGAAGRKRLATGVTPPFQMMQLLGRVHGLRHLAENPAAFSRALKARTWELVKAVQNELTDGVGPEPEVANASSKSPRAVVTARLETVANLWAELVRFGFADETAVRAELAAEMPLEKLAQSRGAAALGEQAAKLLDIHLRIAGAAQQPAGAKRWRDKILAELDLLVRGQKGKNPLAPYTVDSPVRYAGMVLDTLVERSATQLPSPGEEFHATVSRLRDALQKVTVDVSLPIHFPPAATAQPPRPSVVLPAAERTALDARLDELAATVPLVLDGTVSAADFAIAADEVSELVARQSDPVLGLRAAALAMLGRSGFDSTQVRRALTALLVLGNPGTPPRAVPGIDLDGLLDDLGERIRQAGGAADSDTEELQAFKNALLLARSDRQWRLSGFDGMSQAGLMDLVGTASEGVVAALSPIILDRLTAVAQAGLHALIHGLLTTDQLVARREQLPLEGNENPGADDMLLVGASVLRALHVRNTELGRTPMAEEELVDWLDQMARLTAIPVTTAPAGVPDEHPYRLEVHRWMARLRLVQEGGGPQLLPRLVALDVLAEELRYHGALQTADTAEQTTRFDRWLRALEHSGLEAFRTTPTLMRSAFVRLLSLKAPEGFEERIALLAGRLEADGAATESAPLHAPARAGLRERLHQADLRFRKKTAGPEVAQEVQAGVTEVLERLGTRRTETDAVTGPEQREAVRQAAVRWVRDDAREPELPLWPLDVLDEGMLLSGPVTTPSGVFVPARGLPGFADDGRAQIQAAYNFPRVSNTTVVHVHTDGAGKFVVGDRLLDPAEFHREVIEPKNLPEGWLLVFVGCDVDTPPAGGSSAAQVIRALAPALHLVGADSPVFTTPDGRVLAIRHDYDAHGAPVPGGRRTGSFTLYPAGGGAGTDLGPDLLASLKEKVPALLGSTNLPISAERIAPAPGEQVRWMPKKKNKSSSSAQPQQPSAATASAATTASAGSTHVPAASRVREEDVWVSFGDPVIFKRHITSMELKTAVNPFSGRRTAWLAGGHQLNAEGSARILDGQTVTSVGPAPGSATEPLVNGVFGATVEYQPLIGGLVTKLATFYPAHLSWTHIRRSSAAAFRNAVVSGEIDLSNGFRTAPAGVDLLLGKFVGTDIFGNWVAGFLQEGQIRSAFPLYRPPAAPRTAGPNPWVRSVQAGPAPATAFTPPPAATEPTGSAVPPQAEKVSPAPPAVQPATAAPRPSAEALQELADAALPPTGRPSAEQVQAWIDALWGAGRRALTAAVLTRDALTAQIDIAGERAKRIPTTQRGSLAESVGILRAVLALESLIEAVPAGAPTHRQDVETALSGLWKAVQAHLLPGEPFQRHAHEVLSVLAAVQELQDEREPEEHQGGWFGQWMALLHSTVLVGSLTDQPPRGVYDQHLRTLATSGMQLLAADQISAGELDKALALLALRQRHETEQRMWLSDIQYATGSRNAATAVAAVTGRIAYLKEEQRRLNDSQATNLAQRRASDADDRYTTWARAIRDRMDALLDDIGRLVTTFPAVKAAHTEILFGSQTMQITRCLWLARELGYLPLPNAWEMVGWAVRTSDSARTSPALVKGYAQEGLEAIRAIKSFFEHPADPHREDNDEGDWDQLHWNLESAEVMYLHATGGPNAPYAGQASFLRMNAKDLARLRSISDPREVKKSSEKIDGMYLAEAQTAKEKRRLFRAAVKQAKADMHWSAQVSQPLGLTAEQVEGRLRELGGEHGAERVLTGTTSPHGMMLQFAHVAQLSYLMPDPGKFAAGLKAAARRVAEAVTATMLTGTMRDTVVANATSSTAYASLTARLETVANTWAELVRFGFADAADIGTDLKAKTGLEQLAQQFGLPELGADTVKLLDIHLRIVSAPDQPAGAKKWRSGLLAELDLLVRGRKGGDPIAPYTQNSPVRYAGMVLDALVERAGRHLPAPGNDFQDAVRTLRKALNKLPLDIAYALETPSKPLGRPALQRPVLSMREVEELAGRLDGLAAMVPLVLDGTLAAEDYNTASLQTVRLATRQADPVLTLRAATMAMLGNHMFEPVVLRRVIAALLELGGPDADPEVVDALDLGTITEGLADMVSKADAAVGHFKLALDRAIKVAGVDRAWSNAGYQWMTSDEFNDHLSAMEASGDASVGQALRTRATSLRHHGVSCVSTGFLTSEQLRIRYAQLPHCPDDSELLSPADHVQMNGHTEVAVWNARMEQLSKRLMPEHEFLGVLDRAAQHIVLATRLTGKMAMPDGAAGYAEETRRLFSRTRFVEERGGIAALPRMAALNATEEELRYRGALLAEDTAETARTFDRWLAALEHAGLDAFRTAPRVLRTAFVRLLSAEPPAGFEKRVARLAARLAAADTPHGHEQPRAMSATDRAALGQRLQAEDTRSRPEAVAVAGGKEILDGVLEVLSRLEMRRAASATGGSHVSTASDNFRHRAERFLQRTGGEGNSSAFTGALKVLASQTVVKPVATPSGLFVRVKGREGFADDGEAQLKAAFGFPKIGNATVVHVHTDGNGHFLVGDRALTPEDFYREVVEPQNLPAGRLLVFVGCDVDTPAVGGHSAARAIRELAPELHLVSADSPVFTAPDGRVVAGDYEFDAEGRPKVTGSPTGGFTLMPVGGDPVPLGPDLVTALKEKIPVLLGSDFPISSAPGVAAHGQWVRWMPQSRKGALSSPTATAGRTSRAGRPTAAAAISDGGNPPLQKSGDMEPGRARVRRPRPSASAPEPFVPSPHRLDAPAAEAATELLGEATRSGDDAVAAEHAPPAPPARHPTAPTRPVPYSRFKGPFGVQVTGRLDAWFAHGFAALPPTAASAGQPPIRTGRRRPVVRNLSVQQFERLHDGDLLAGALPPEDILLEEQWHHLRPSADVHKVDHTLIDEPFILRVRPEVRRYRVALPTANGTKRTLAVTEFTARILLHPEPGVTGADIKRVKKAAADAVDEYHNHQHRLADPEGSQLHARVTFTDLLLPGTSIVRLGPAHAQNDPTASFWYTDMASGAFAHELAHLIFGLRDRYSDPDADARVTPLSPGVRLDGGLMTQNRSVWFTSSTAMRDHNGNIVSALNGLRDADIAHITALAAPAAQLPPATGEAGPVSLHPKAAGPLRLQDVKLRGSLQRLLSSDEFQIPPDHDGLQYVRELRMAKEYLGRPPADRAEFVRVTTLLARASELYEIAPEELFEDDLLTIFRKLRDHLGALHGWHPDDMPPAHEARSAVRQLLGLDDSTSVGASEMDAAARAVAYALASGADPSATTARQLLEAGRHLQLWRELDRPGQPTPPELRTIGRLHILLSNHLGDQNLRAYTRVDLQGVLTMLFGPRQKTGNDTRVAGLYNLMTHYNGLELTVPALLTAAASQAARPTTTPVTKA
ncbi:hypothetical protein KNE206_73660 [Kitasatospora sp. NE20-6]